MEKPERAELLRDLVEILVAPKSWEEAKPKRIVTHLRAVFADYDALEDQAILFAESAGELLGVLKARLAEAERDRERLRQMIDHHEQPGSGAHLCGFDFAAMREGGGE
jgi:hypothetical protein